MGRPMGHPWAPHAGHPCGTPWGPLGHMGYLRAVAPRWPLLCPEEAVDIIGRFPAAEVEKAVEALCSEAWNRWIHEDRPWPDEGPTEDRPLGTDRGPTRDRLDLGPTRDRPGQ